jgi:hypothetical protein
MEESLIRFPITCPRCGNESLTEFRAVIATIAVIEWQSMRLYSPCHEVFWEASDIELDQIGAYIGASWIGASPGRTTSTAMSSMDHAASTSAAAGDKRSEH